MAEKTLQERRAEQRDNDLKQVMSTAYGRRFVWQELSGAGVFRTTFVAGATDATAFNEGGRARGLMLLHHIMAVCPGSYLEMQREAMDNEHRERQEDQLDQRKRNSDDRPVE